MSSPQCEINEVEIIRALIIARGKSGATLKEIKRDYQEQVGKELNKGDDFASRKWLEQIAHIRTECRDGFIVYFSESPDQSHLTEMINKQRARPRITKYPSRSLNHSSVPQSNHSSAFKTPKRWMKTRTFRSKKIYENKSFDVNQSVSRIPKLPPKPNASIYQSSFLQTPSQSRKRPRPIPSTSIFEQNTKKFRSAFCDTIQEDHQVHDFNINTSSCHNFNLSSMTDRLSEVNGHVDPNVPEFYKSTLVGDNFFLNIAVNELGFRLTKVDRIIQSGYCVSGQTIAQATKQIETMSPNQVILVNIGSCDIVNGKELVDLIWDMLRLMRTCQLKEITPILTTILPIGNFRLGNRVDVTNGFNELLIKNHFNFPVIELHKVFTQNDGALNADCYQQAVRHVSGIRKPLVFWSRLGRQRVLKTLTQELGEAFLKILVK